MNKVVSRLIGLVASVWFCSVIQAGPTAKLLTDPLPGYVAMVNAAIAKLDAHKADEHWTFKMITQLKGETLVAVNNPTGAAGHKLQLQSVDGQTPTEQRLRDFNQQQIKRIESETKNGGPLKYADIFAGAQLELLSDSSDQVLLGFTPVLKGLDSKHLAGTLELNPSAQTISAISIFNTNDLSPAFSVSLTEFKLDMRFASIDGELLLSHMESITVGKIGFLKPLDNRLVIDFTDFKQAAVEIN